MCNPILLFQFERSLRPGSEPLRQGCLQDGILFYNKPNLSLPLLSLAATRKDMVGRFLYLDVVQ